MEIQSCNLGKNYNKIKTSIIIIKNLKQLNKFMKR